MEILIKLEVSVFDRVSNAVFITGGPLGDDPRDGERFQSNQWKDSCCHSFSSGPYKLQKSKILQSMGLVAAED